MNIRFTAAGVVATSCIAATADADVTIGDARAALGQRSRGRG